MADGLEGPLASTTNALLHMLVQGLISIVFQGCPDCDAAIDTKRIRLVAKHRGTSLFTSARRMPFARDSSDHGQPLCQVAATN